MPYKVFREMQLARVARVPLAYSRSVRWLPQIGDTVPDFHVETTEGPLDFHQWAEGRWVFLFSHPAPFTAVCTTELAAFASLQDEFEARGVSLLGLSSGSLEDQRRWHADIKAIYGVPVALPMAVDASGLLAELFGMIHPRHDPDSAVRKAFAVGPDLRIRMILEYPMAVGRSTAEVLRVFDALQTVERFNVAVGADWRKGDDCLLLPSDMGPARFDYGWAWRRVCSYLRTVADPWSFPEAAEEEPLPEAPRRAAGAA